MTELNPKSTFQLFHAAEAGELKKNREQKWLKVASVYSLGQMSHDNATAEQLQGAHRFIHTLLNLWDGGEPERKMPRQTLETYDRPPEEVAKERQAEEAKNK